MSEERYAKTYPELFNLIEKDIKAKLPEKSRTLISEFVGYRHMEKLLELKDREKKVISDKEK